MNQRNLQKVNKGKLVFFAPNIKKNFIFMIIVYNEKFNKHQFYE